MKSIVFAGKSLEALKRFPAAAKREAGYQLDAIQRGLAASDWKTMQGLSGVREIRIHQGGEYRVIYVAKYEDAIYVLHAFQKKTQRTSKTDIDTIKRNLKEIKKWNTQMFGMP